MLLPDIVPARVETIHRVRSVPLVGLAAAAAMGLFVLVYALALSIRVRSRDLAILRALGLPVRRARRIVGWIGALYAAGIVVIGVPLGLLLGAVVWRPVASGIGVATTVEIAPLLWLVVPATFLVAWLASWVPARRIGRRDVTSLLRPE